MLFFAFFYYCSVRIENAKKILSKREFTVRNTGCVVKTLRRNTEAVSAVISFYTPSGNLIKSYERSWPGWELKFECIRLKFGKSFWIFPHRVFSDETKYGTGVSLFNSYSRNGFPAIYDYRFLSSEEKSALSSLFRFAKFSPSLFKFFSGAEAVTINLREFKPDKEYTLFVNSNRQIYLKKN